MKRLAWIGCLVVLAIGMPALAAEEAKPAEPAREAKDGDKPAEADKPKEGEKAGDEKKDAEKKDGEKKAEKPVELKEAKIADVVRDLIEEGREAIKTSKKWPRTEPDFATKHNLKAEKDEVVAALSRRIDRNPALDGYVKWQLLSFLPKDPQFSSRDFGALVRGLPEFLTMAQPTSSQRRIFAAFEKEGNERMLPKIREQIDAFQASVAEIDTLNEPAMKYRDFIIGQIPEDNGVRALIRLQDIEARYMAGEPSYEKAVDALIREVAAHKTDASWNQATRQRIHAGAARLNKLKTPLIRSVEVMATGQTKVVGFQPVFKHRAFETIEAHLAGQEPKAH